jgi:hypothetical protein
MLALVALSAGVLLLARDSRALDIGADGSLRAAGTMVETHIGTNALLLAESTFTVGINFSASYFVTRVLAIFFAQEEVGTPA